MNAAILTDLGQAYRHHGAEAFAQRLYIQLFPHGSPQNSMSEETRIQRRLRKLMAGIAKVHATIDPVAAVKEVWQVLVRMLWPLPEPKPVPVTTGKYNVCVSDVPRTVRNVSIKGRSHRRQFIKTPVTEKAYVYADAAWWEAAWFKYEQNYWKTQAALRERARAEYADWWLKTLRYVEWWEEILTPATPKVRPPPMVTTLVHANTVNSTREGAFTKAEAKADVGLAKLTKSIQKLDYKKPRKRVTSTTFASRTDAPADLAWWQNIVLGNAVSADGEDFTAYLIRHFGAENVVHVVGTILAPRARNVWLRNELTRKDPRVQLSDRLTEKLFLSAQPESPVNMSEKGYGAPKKRTYQGRDMNDPKIAPSTKPTAESVLAEIRG